MSLRQLTFAGNNTLARWNIDGTKLVYLCLEDRAKGEQVFEMNANGTDKRLVSSGNERCLSGSFAPDSRFIYYASTAESRYSQLPDAARSLGALGSVSPDCTIYRAWAGASPGLYAQQQPQQAPATSYGILPVPVFSRRKAYLGENSVAPNGGFMVWTSDYQGDLELYRSDLNGNRSKRLTHGRGYDGGASVAWDSRHIVYQHQEVPTRGQRAEYTDLLRHHLLRPGKLEIWVVDLNGNHNRALTHLGCVSFGPAMFPDGRKVIFSSNYPNPDGERFDLYTINVDGTGLERITFSSDFNGFPMLTRDGKYLVFSSNRSSRARHEADLFVAEWKD